ncbi:hypothetical protein [Rhodococcus maanshanensis]|uniref:Uncharacterized protein n=1 Tax=Rhodococcus maanshanensis TaxID=183556 RepID=A0A1H7W314_9NOCA|nr:hypothetical protein [Rhodococcus maanshanensis]SEM15861.1 hypothetical protein SAMN05444583_12459 [Rhodococcus maanshanensis]
MLRSLARRGASVLVAAAVLGGGLALGGGTASAEEVPGSASGSVEMINILTSEMARAFSSVLTAAAGSSEDDGSVSFSCRGQGADCPI